MAVTIKENCRYNLYMILSNVLTSSLVVWLLLVKYVWKPARPKILQTEKKHTTPTITLLGDNFTASKNGLLSFVTKITISGKRTWNITFLFCRNHICIYSSNNPEIKILTHNNMRDCTYKYKNAKKREGYYKSIKISIISSAHAITNPWTVMIESFCKNSYL